MKTNRLIDIVILLLIMSCNSSAVKQTDNDRILVWSQEFDNETQLDERFWSYDIGDGCPTLCGWGNNEQQIYVKSSKNIYIKDGKLVIKALADNKDDSLMFTSARINTKGKKSWKYGYVEVRAKIPAGVGTWPAIWMLPNEWKYGNWPKSGEIDIMEHVGHNPGVVHATVHTAAHNGMYNNAQGHESLLNQPDEFNIYAANWTPEKMDFMVNDKIYFTYTNKNSGFETWPFDQEFYLILNIAVGGNWGGEEGIDKNDWPQQMEVDYIRVYENYQSEDLMSADTQN